MPYKLWNEEVESNGERIEAYDKRKKRHASPNKVKRSRRKINRSKSNLKIFNININNLKLKIIELNVIIQDLKPDIILLQETKRDVNSPKIEIGGYEIIERLAEPEINKNGLIVGYKKA